MNDPIRFLQDMAAYYQTVPVPEQVEFVRRFQKSITQKEPELIEADGGIGKTIGYLVCGMLQAQAKHLPLIIATSTITNRDQIKTEFSKITGYARTIGHPIADIPFFNYRSARDYVSRKRLTEVLARLENAKDTPALVLNELREVRDRLNDSHDALLDNVMPYDIVYGNETMVERREIAAHAAEAIEKLEKGAFPESFFEIRDAVADHAETACVVVMTQTMLAANSRFKDWIDDGKVAAVIIDEVDKLTSMDFVAFTSLTVADIEKVLNDIEATEMVINEARAALTRLQSVIDEIKSTTNKQQVILIYSRIGEDLTKAVHDAIINLAQCLYGLSEMLMGEAVTRGIASWSDEILYRRLLFETEELIIAAQRICEFMFAHGRQESMVNKTDLEVFLSWDEGEDEFRVVTARPGAVMEWLFRDRVSVPVLLTTAFLGEDDKWFASKIRLPMRKLNREGAIRATRYGYGSLKFVYFTPESLHDAVSDRAPNPEHFDDLERILRLSPWSWEPGKRILVLTPGYQDIEEIHKRLQQKGSNAPIFPHRARSNINEIRDRLIQSPEGGILLTVYWEGFNIVGNGGQGRRGLIDVLLMARIPFQRPNRMLEALNEHLGRGGRLVYKDVRIEAKRRIHQGFNRVIRGPMDAGVVLICDNRFPPPAVLTDIYDQISPRPEYNDLIDAIPERFRSDENCFMLVDAETWETIE